MSSRLLQLAHGTLLLLLAMAGCASPESMLSPGLNPPAAVRATAISMSGIRLDWEPQGAGVLDKYRIERREDLSGRFTLLTEVTPNATSYFNTGLDADRFYGYRIVAVSREGERSEPSVVAGAHTAPLPGIQVGTGTAGGTGAGIADPNGYRLSLRGPRDTSVTVGTFDLVTISPLPAGEYTLTLSDVLPTCTISGDTVQTVTVVDTGLVTRAGAQFTATCSDPARGRIVAEVTVTGDSVDASGYSVNYAGILPDDTLPVFGGAVVAGSGGETVINALRPGDYELSLAGVDLPCRLTSSANTSVQVVPLSVDTVRFEVTCPDRGGGNSTAPLVYRNVWSAVSVPSGQSVNLDVTLDLTAKPGQTLGVIQAELRYDPALLTYTGVSAPPGGLLGTPVVNAGSPGSLTWLGVGATGPSGIIPAARFSFNVIGATGSAARTRTTIQLTADASGSEALDTLFRIVEDTVAIDAGGGGANQSPSANANGPYSGTAGTAISFSSAGSTDPDGTIVSYAWSFSDGTTSTQANPAKSFGTAGTYTASLIVTDDDGATGSAQANVTVTGGGPPPTGPTWTSTFGAFDQAFQAYPLVITLNLTQDLSQTPGPEAVQSFTVDSLVWDPTVFQYHSLAFGSGGGSFNTTDAIGGCKCKLSFNGTPTANSGIVTIARVLLKPVGAAGRSMTTKTAVGPVLSTPANGAFNYRSVMQIVEGSIVLP